MKYFIVLLLFSNVVFCQSERKGIYNSTENTFSIDDQIYKATHFFNGHSVIDNSSFYGLIDSTGTVVIPIIYENLGFLKDGLLVATKDRKCGYVDAKGKIIIPFTYDLADDFKNGVATVQKNGKCGIIDKKGNQVTALLYDHIDKFDNDQSGLARVNRDKKWGFINKSGTEIIACIYQNANFFSDGLALITKVNGTTGYLDKVGKLIIPFDEFTQADNFRNGKARVQKGNTTYFIDKKGEIIK